MDHARTDCCRAPSRDEWSKCVCSWSQQDPVEWIRECPAETPRPGDITMDNPRQQVGYALGVNIAQSLAAQGLTDFDATDLLKGLGDGLRGGPARGPIRSIRSSVPPQRLDGRALREEQGGGERAFPGRQREEGRRHGHSRPVSNARSSSRERDPSRARPIA